MAMQQGVVRIWSEVGVAHIIAAAIAHSVLVPHPESKHTMYLGLHVAKRAHQVNPHNGNTVLGQTNMQALHELYCKHSELFKHQQGTA